MDCYVEDANSKEIVINHRKDKIIIRILVMEKHVKCVNKNIQQMIII